MTYFKIKEIPVEIEKIPEYYESDWRNNYKSDFLNDTALSDPFTASAHRRDWQLMLKYKQTNQAKEFINDIVSNDVFKKFFKGKYKENPSQSITDFFKMRRETSKPISLDVFINDSVLEEKYTHIHQQPNEFYQPVVDAFKRSLHKLWSYNNEKRKAIHLYKEKADSEMGKSSLKKRQEEVFKNVYRKYLEYDVVNKDGHAIVGSAIRDAYLLIKYNKLDGHWAITFEYGRMRDNIPFLYADQNWKKTVAEENIAVADRVIVTKAELEDASDINGIPCSIFKASWIKRVSNPRSLKTEDGYVVRLGNKDTPIAIRTTPVFSQAKKIAENSATKEFFKQMGNMSS